MKIEMKFIGREIFKCNSDMHVGFNKRKKCGNSSKRTGKINWSKMSCSSRLGR